MGRREFVAFVTVMMAMGAMAVDIMLPVFPDIRADFGMASGSAQVAWLITAYFLGMAVGPWLYGPVSDRFGRRPPLFAGLVVYVVAAIGASLVSSFGALVAFRFVWGLGAAAPRSISVAMVRDRFEGVAMARLMSMIMAVFLLVPILAPSVGAGLNALLPWQSVFWVPAAVGIGLGVWAFVRLPETLTRDRQRPLTVGALREAIGAVVGNPMIRWYALAITCLTGALTGYLNSSELIVEDVYDYGRYFPLFFAAVAVMLSIANLTNGRLVERVGLVPLLRRTSVAAAVAAVVQVIVAFAGNGRPNFWLFAVVIAIVMPLAQGLVPNANTAAMLPVPHVAGTAAAVIGTLTMAGGALLGTVVSSVFDGTVRPYAVCIALLTGAAAMMILGATRATALVPAPV